MPSINLPDLPTAGSDKATWIRFAITTLLLLANAFLQFLPK